MDSAVEGAQLLRGLSERARGSSASVTIASLNRWIASITTQYHDAVRELKATKAQLLKQSRELAQMKALATM
jgi:hypothetical protein